MGGNGVKGLVVQREKGGERWKKIVFCFALFRSLLLLTTLGKKRAHSAHEKNYLAQTISNRSQELLRCVTLPRATPAGRDLRMKSNFLGGQGIHFAGENNLNPKTIPILNIRKLIQMSLIFNSMTSSSITSKIDQLFIEKKKCFHNTRLVAHMQQGGIYLTQPIATVRTGFKKGKSVCLSSSPCCPISSNKILKFIFRIVNKVSEFVQSTHLLLFSQSWHMHNYAFTSVTPRQIFLMRHCTCIKNIYCVSQKAWTSYIYFLSYFFLVYLMSYHDFQKSYMECLSAPIMGNAHAGRTCIFFFLETLQKTSDIMFSHFLRQKTIILGHFGKQKRPSRFNESSPPMCIDYSLVLLWKNPEWVMVCSSLPVPSFRRISPTAYKSLILSLLKKSISNISNPQLETKFTGEEQNCFKKGGFLKPQPLQNGTFCHI
ncbi:hypothetical protein VP01_664g1 [Puccinia sorghi]|uniref:Uncharacterized protein n=1 Tax=Puccinia sorghi TaxID=27349 RepID=A0A0L6UEZ8_9BASI|nr:hypothetical protein VP01_664g1 [Puccinia sorghi]